MSTAYNAPGSGVSSERPLGKVNFGWIAEAFELFKANAGVWLVAILAIYAGSIVLSIIMQVVMLAGGMTTAMTMPPPRPGAFLTAPAITAFQVILFFFYYVILGVCSAYIMGSLYRMAVKQVRGEMITFSDIWSGGSVFVRMIGFTFLLGVVVFGAEAVCATPIALMIFRQHSSISAIVTVSLLTGLVVTIGGCVFGGLLLSAPALIADGEGIGDSLRRSIRGMRQDWLRAAGFVFVGGLLLSLGVMLTCGLGMFVLYPMWWLVSALAYRDMVGMPYRPAAPVPTYAPTAPQPGVWPPPPTNPAG